MAPKTVASGSRNEHTNTALPAAAWQEAYRVQLGRLYSTHAGWIEHESQLLSRSAAWEAQRGASRLAVHQMQLRQEEASPQEQLKRRSSLFTSSTSAFEKLKEMATKSCTQWQLTVTAEGDHASIATIQADIDKLGGIKAYQKASIQGQAADRGGDSSVVLMKWLEPVQKDLSTLDPRLSLLEVGSLSTKNEVSKSNLFNIVRIDLNSPAPGIQQQDFMQRPLPANPSEKFHIISLSLVLNFVPDAKGRGDMLRRTTAFLRPCERDDLPGSTGLLFLVLPAPCTLNSRYFNEERLARIMASLGYALLQRKQTSKLVYHLWQLRDKPSESRWFPKRMIKDGAAMNNFCVVLD